MDIDEGKQNVQKNKAEDQFTCEVCYDDIEVKDMVQMEDCGHRLCSECFQAYLESKVAAGPDVVFATCPDQKCKMIVPTRLFKLLLDEAKMDLFNQFLVKAFVDLSTAARWCPGQDCDLAYEKQSGTSVEINCRCGARFCIGCD